jgi:hypothetical protein
MDGPNFQHHLDALLAHVDTTAEMAAAEFPLINAPDGLTAEDVEFYHDDAALLFGAQKLFLDAIAARYRVALARAVNARLFTEVR